MLEAARVIGFFAGGLLLAAIAMWVTTLRKPLPKSLNGRLGSRSGQAELTSQLLVMAAGLSTGAAGLAVAAWMVR